MKPIDVAIQNFGKIKQAAFQVKPFTVIAGKNACGKSFITRGLYSVFSSLNKDNYAIELVKGAFKILDVTEHITGEVTDDIDKIKAFKTKIDSLTGDLLKNIGIIFQQENSTLAVKLIQAKSLMTDVRQLRSVYDEFVDHDEFAVNESL
jgi:energy-coupling factor transporter ATP-binding protein EcfA2